MIGVSVYACGRRTGFRLLCRDRALPPLIPPTVEPMPS